MKTLALVSRMFVGLVFSFAGVSAFVTFSNPVLIGGLSGLFGELLHAHARR